MCVLCMCDSHYGGDSLMSRSFSIYSLLFQVLFVSYAPISIHSNNCLLNPRFYPFVCLISNWKQSLCLPTGVLIYAFSLLNFLQKPIILIQVWIYRPACSRLFLGCF